MQNLEGEILVVDNASTDNSFDFFANRFNEVQFTWNKNNIGFAKANNSALQKAKGEYILFLNPDTIVPEDCFEKCIAFLKEQKNNAALGIRMLDGSGNFLRESKRGFPSPLTSFYKLSGLGKIFPRSKTFSKYHLGYLDEHKDHEVDVLAGAFMMIPKKILDAVGGFDEDFFMYGEDIDLSFRIQEAGFINYYFAGSSIIHFKGESTKKGSLNYVKMFYKAMSIFVKKHYGSRQAGLYSFFIHIAIFLRASMAAGSRIFKRKWQEENAHNLSDEKKYILIAGSEDECTKAKNLLKYAGRKSNLSGRIGIDSEDKTGTKCTFNELQKCINSIAVKEIIFCEGILSFKQIIETIVFIPRKITIEIFSSGCHAIIGSNDKDATGNYILNEKMIAGN